MEASSIRLRSRPRWMKVSQCWWMRGVPSFRAGRLSAEQSDAQTVSPHSMRITPSASHVGVEGPTPNSMSLKQCASLVAYQIWSVLTCCHVFINARCQWFHDDFTGERLPNLRQWLALLIPIVAATNLKLGVIATRRTMRIKLYLFKWL